VSHTGKLYNLLAGRIARTLTSELPGVEEAYCYLLSRIGSPISDPALADVVLRLAEPGSLEGARRGASMIVRAQLQDAPELWREVVEERCPVF
jgi:S-adenosylmethionine synthetase